MPYTPADGIIPSTSDELDQQFTDNYNNAFGTAFTLQQILSSNQFKVFEVTTKPYFMQLEAKFASAQALIFQSMVDANLAVNIPAGVLPEGRLKAFEGLCDGISYRENYTDPNTNYYEMTICFDNLDLTQEGKINDAFAISNPQATNTKPDYYAEGGDGEETDWLDFTYQDATGYTKTVYFKNLAPSDYSKIDVRITWQLVKDGIAPVQQDVEDLFRQRFAEYNKIGVDFDPDRYLSSQDFTGIADFILESKLPAETSFIGGRRVCAFNNKYILNIVAFS